MSTASSSSTNPTILLTGLDPATYPFPSEELRRAIKAAIDELNAAAAQSNLQLEYCALRRGTEVSDLRTSLKTKHYDGIVIGAGIRTMPPIVPILEQLIDAIRKDAPDAVIMFNKDPVDSLQCVKRWFPNIPNFNPPPSTFQH